MTSADQPELPCPFCFVARERVAFEDELTRALWDAFPVNPGHVLIVPRRHVPTWFDASHQERLAILAALDRARDLVTHRHNPDGYNIGLNVGAAAGQTVFHLHLHLIPRYGGDVPDPRGGVRHVIPGRANYLAVSPGAGTERKSRLVSGGDDDPLMPYLGEELASAHRADIAVGFVLPSGVVRIEKHLRDFLGRGGRLRLLTGDYLGLTDPDALTRLLDLDGDRQIRIFETNVPTGPAWPGPLPALTFHPKAYVFHHTDGTGAAFVGSSNLSESALQTGIEWNYRTVSSAEGTAFADVAKAFEKLFAHPATQELTPDWIERYRARRVPPAGLGPSVQFSAEIRPEPRQIPEPHGVQLEALAALEATRRAGNTAGLVVLATGLGKTWLSAFDSKRPEYRRILFVAHREEILHQSRTTFRAIRPDARLGLYSGEGRDPHADVLFASIQTLGRAAHLERFGREAFDYIVVDEFHHAAAPTYRRLIDYFRPRFLLGLTATPERTDGGDLLALCQENLVYRCDLLEGVRRNHLCRFRYFGVPDEVDYRNIPWRNARFDEDELTRHVATQSRARNAYDQLQKRGGTRTLAFCVSQRHADFMADFFRQQGLSAVAVHSGQTSAPRAKSLEELSSGLLDVICAVDVFNEGLDLPELDTVLMLRPTESRILWLQQFGRGLRKTADDKQLTVIDYIGNHRTFLLKPQTLFSLQSGGQELLNLLEQARKGPIEIAPGCFVTYELETIEILRALTRVTANRLDTLKRYYEDFKLLHGVRPQAVEAFHDGYNPRSLRPQTGSWLGFVASLQGLDAERARAHDRHRAFLDALETTEMTRSYKMLVLLAMLNEDRFPGEITIEELGEAVLALASRNQRLREDLGSSADRPEDLRAHLERNPIEAWTGGRGTAGTPYFAYENGVFRSLLNTETPTEKTALQELTRELADWRLAEYLDRVSRQPSDQPRHVCKVSHANSRPMIFLPSRDMHPDLPTGTTPLNIDGVAYEADFVKVALNVVHLPGDDRNRLPEILRGWFGPDAGSPGTRHEATLGETDGVWTLQPLGRREGQLQLWRRYSREEIPGLFGFPFSTAIWNSGFVVQPGHVFLLVTLNKRGKGATFQYRDHFLSPTRFEWESQNRTAQSDAHGQLIRSHREKGVLVHLFARAASKVSGGGAAPFVYCGDVEFVDWEGEKPITVRWQLPQPLPDNLREQLGQGPG